MKYQYEGTVYEATNATELVHQLHEASRIQASDDVTWMKDASEALSPMGMKIRWETPELFVQDLEKHGILKKQEG